jgi:hypothetical protein
VRHLLFEQRLRPFLGFAGTIHPDNGDCRTWMDQPGRVDSELHQLIRKMHNWPARRSILGTPSHGWKLRMAIDDEEMRSPTAACLEWLEKQPLVIQPDIAVLTAMLLPDRTILTSVTEDPVGYVRDWLSHPSDDAVCVGRAVTFRALVDFAIGRHFSPDGHEKAIHSLAAAAQQERFAGFREPSDGPSQRQFCDAWTHSSKEWEALKGLELDDAYLHRYIDRSLRHFRP